MRNIIERVKNIKNIEYILLSIVILLAFITRIYKIKNPVADWHSWRQADTASVSREYVEKGINLLYPRYHDISTTQTRLFNPEGYRFVEFPIFNAINALLFSTFLGVSLEIWGRLISVLSACISVYLVFLLGKRYISLWGGLLAAFFFAFLPFNIYFTRVILPEPLATTLALLSLWFFSTYLQKDTSLNLYLSAFFFGLAILTKPFTVFYLIPMAYLAIKKYGLRACFEKKNLLFAFSVATIPFFLWRAWMGQFPEGIPLWRWAFNGDGIRFRPAFWRWIFGERLGKLILGIGGLVPFSFAVLSYQKRKAFIHSFLLGMFLYVSVFASANVKHDYYQTITIPAISLALAQGSIAMWNIKAMNKLISRLMLIFCIGLMFDVGYSQIREFYNINRPEIIQAGMAVDRVTPKDALVIAAYNGDTAFLYQTKRWGWPVVDRPIEELIEKGAGYYVSVDLNHPQTQEFSDRYKVIEQTPSFVIVKLEKED